MIGGRVGGRAFRPCLSTPFWAPMLAGEFPTQKRLPCSLGGSDGLGWKATDLGHTEGFGATGATVGSRRSSAPSGPSPGIPRPRSSARKLVARSCWGLRGQDMEL